MAETASEKSYRERALKLYPHLCGRCGREFSGVRLQELTVHHKDNNHSNNPIDGSNWELLCIYCHENEHAKLIDSAGRTDPGNTVAHATHNPFAGLAGLIKKKD
jgi:5-methylcytosine-specific restriction endonuclease McrA